MYNQKLKLTLLKDFPLFDGNTWIQTYKHASVEVNSNSGLHKQGQYGKLMILDNYLEMPNFSNLL